MVKTSTKPKGRDHSKNDNNSTGVLICTICGCLTVLFASFLFPLLQHENQSKENQLKDKLRSSEIFMACITQTVNFAKLYSQYQNALLNEKDKEIWKIKTERSFIYWEKLVSLNPPYEAACGAISINFDPPISSKADVLKKKFDSFFDLGVSSTEQTKGEEEKLLLEIDNLYNQLVELLREDIKKFK